MRDRRYNMNFTNKQEVQNMKTGTAGWMVSKYNRTTDGKEMIEVVTLSRGMKTAHWESKNVKNL